MSKQGQSFKFVSEKILKICVGTYSIQLISILNTWNWKPHPYVPMLKELEHFDCFRDRVETINPFMPTGAFNIYSPRDCVFRHNGGTSGAPLKPLRDDSALRALSTLRGLRGAPEVPPLFRETQSLGQQMLNAPVGINGLSGTLLAAVKSISFCNYFFVSYNCW